MDLQNLKKNHRKYKLNYKASKLRLFIKDDEDYLLVKRKSWIEFYYMHENHTSLSLFCS